MTFCANCGQQLAPDTAFCGGCGTPTAAPEATEPTLAFDASQPSSTPPPAAPPAPPAPPVPPAPPAAAPPAPPTAPYGTAPQGHYPPQGAPQGQFPPPGAPHGHYPQQGHYPPQGAPQGQFPPGGYPPQGPYAPAPPKEMPQWARHLVVGNWIGAAIIAAGALLSSLVLATLIALLGKPADFGVGNTLTSILALMGGTFGADTFTSVDTGSEELTSYMGVFPLTLTLAVTAAIVLVFRRVTAGYNSAVAGFTDGVRAALISAVVMTILSLIFRNDTEDMGAASGQLLGRLASGEEDSSWGLNAPGAFFMTLLFITAVVGVTTLTRRDWLGAKAQVVHDWIAGPVRGLAALALALPVAGLIGYIAVIVSGDGDYTLEGANSDEIMTAIAIAIAFAGNGGMALLALGSGGKFGSESSWRSDGDRDSDSQMEHLTYFTSDQGEPGMWIAVALAPVVLALGAWAVTRFRNQQARPTTLHSLLTWAGSLVVLVPLLIRLANGHTSASARDGGDSRSEMTAMIGIDGPISSLVIVLYAALITLIVALAVGAIDKDTLSGQAKQFAAMAQHNPGAPQQQWGQPGAAQQQWGQPGAPQQQWGQPPAPPQPGAPQQQWGQPPAPPQPGAQQWGQPSAPPAPPAQAAPATGPQHFGTPPEGESSVDETSIAPPPAGWLDEPDGHTRRREDPPADA
jgi:hypothetical protein